MGTSGFKSSAWDLSCAQAQCLCIMRSTTGLNCTFRLLPRAFNSRISTRRQTRLCVQHTSTYDAQVAEWMWKSTSSGPPPELCVPLRQQQTLRYGENPHQPAAFYSDLSLAEANAGGVASATQHHGKELSYNNYLDADAAFSSVCDFSEPTCVVVKHTNPCGVASREDLCEAYELAVKADPISAFGGIVAFNRPLTLELAQRIREFRSPTDGETRMFYEIVIAPEYTPEGLECLQGKSKTLRILEASARRPQGTGLRQVAGGWLWQVRTLSAFCTLLWCSVCTLASHSQLPVL